MHRVPLFLCAIALLGSALSAGLYLRIGNSKQVLEQRLADTTTRATKLESDLAATNEHNGSLKSTLGTLEADLESTRGKLATSEAHASRLDRDLAQAKNVLSVYELTARALAAELGSLREDLEDSRASNASPEAVAAYKTTIADLERQLATAKQGVATPTGAGTSTALFTNRSGRATVLTVGPQNAFVVLNFGSTRGAQIGQKLNVSQGTEVVATVLVSDVRTNFSVAQVLPDTLRGVLHKGDSALLLR